jgi:hypothetical protein
MILWMHYIKVKENFTLEQAMKAQKESRVIALLFITSALNGGEWLTTRPGRFIPGKHPVPTVRETEWAPG